MKEAFTISQYIEIKTKFRKEVVVDLLQKMHNYKPLFQKNISAYRTFLNWAGRENNNQHNERKQTVAERHAAGFEITRESLGETMSEIAALGGADYPPEVYYETRRPT